MMSFYSCLKGEVTKKMINSRIKMLNSSTDYEQADQRMELILDAIKQKDKSGLKQMFSKQALNEANDINSSIDYLFDFFKGKEITWKREKQAVDEKIRHGKIIKEAKTWYNVDTDKQKYLVFMLDFTEYTGHPDKVGLYSLRVIKAEDRKTQFTYWQDMKIPGIYRP